MESESLNNNCPICLTPILPEDKCIMNCSHVFCKTCLHDWFNRNKVSCPLCRVDINEYINNESTHYIVKVPVSDDSTPSGVNSTRIILELRQKQVYLKMVIMLNIIYLFYSLYNMSELSSGVYYYKHLYNNCSVNLLQYQQNENDYSDYSDYISTEEQSIRYQFQTLNPINVYLNNHIYQCYFPIYYINKCLSNLV